MPYLVSSLGLGLGEGVSIVAEQLGLNVLTFTEGESVS